MKVQSFGMSDVGRKRKKNEDSFLLSDELGLYMVADGMGGHSGGEFASRMAIETVEDIIKNINSDPEATVISGVNTEEDDFGARLRYALQMASKKIFDRALYDPSLRGMGTTSVVALFCDGRLYIANVGDSRAYLVHANKMRQITTDHSLVSEQIKAGLITQADARTHKLKNVITRSVGYQEEVEIDVRDFEVHRGDKILLCSDGLSNMLDDTEIESILANATVKESCKTLIEKANAKGGDDNITALVMLVEDPSDDTV